MRNLRCIQRTRHKLESQLTCTASAWDIINDAIIYTLGPTVDNALIELRSRPANSGHGGDARLVASWDAPCPLSDLDVDQIIDLHYLVASEQICLVLAGGDIVLVRSDPQPDQEKIEIVGSVDVGITAAAWSPDDDLLAISTRANTLLYMTASFDNIANASYSANDTSLSKQVSVGWGKSETQFKGKRAKALRDPTVPEKVDEGKLSSSDDATVTISWRGDGAFLSVNTIEPQNRRMIRVYSREGVLDSVSEPTDGLEGALAWKPSGQLIAGVQRIEEACQVVFFERNGLRHGELDLRLSVSDSKTWASKINLVWNVDSSVLAITFLDRIQLWTMGNYHYYLKQEYHFTSIPPRALHWHPEEPTRFLVQELTGAEEHLGPVCARAIDGRLPPYHTIFTIQLVSTLSQHPALPPHDQGILAVIDGSKIRVTPLRQANVPPPMALYELDLPEIALDAAISRSSSIVAIMHRNSISRVKFQHKAEPTVKTESGPNKSSTPWSSTNIVPIQIAAVGDGEVYVLSKDLEKNEFLVYKSPDGSPCYTSSNAVKMSLFASVNYQCLCLIEDKTILKLQPQSQSRICTFPMEVVEAALWSSLEADIAFGLTSNRLLYANERLLIRNCTSFLVTDSHLVATTANHLLKFIHLTQAEDLEIPSDEPEVDERCRNIERGAKLVSVMPTTFAVVLQMPRGNLETIFPRALVLAGIRRSLQERKYKTALLACRNHRVDMNILHDYLPAQFIRDAAMIVRDLGKLEYIDLLLSQLSEEDVSQTLYRNTMPNARKENIKDSQENGNAISISMPIHPVDGTGSSEETASKVNRICDAFLAVLESKRSSNLQNVITAHVCKKPPNISAALDLISTLGSGDSDEVGSAIEHLCFLTDVNLIYDAALGSYKLDLALAVAQQSQKDPREYLPYLQNLQLLPESERRFEIDDDLKRYSKALTHLHDYATTERFLAYTQKHELYANALELNKYNKTKHDAVLRSYADFLLERSRFQDAAVAFEALLDYESASSAYSSGNMWRESLSCAYLAPLPAESIHSLAHALAETLAESRDFTDAATIYSDHLGAISEAARAYCKGHRYSDGLRLLARHGRGDLIPEIIDTELAEGFSSLIELISDCKSQLSAQVPRIAELRARKARDPLAFYEGTAEAGTGADIPDNISLAPSETSTAGGTLLTRYTGKASGTVGTGASRRTSKNRRREERKRARGKKGSVYEEEYLVNSVARLVERVNETSEDVQRCAEALARRAKWEQGKTLQTGFQELVRMCEKAVADVWVDDKAKQNTGEDEHVERPMGGDGVLWDSVEEAKKGQKAPTVKAFVGSALLSA